HVRALLAIDLHAYEVLVHQLGRARILEGLPLHHVAPVAGRVADRDQQRLVLLARASERNGSPRQPVHRVLGVLAEVGGGLGGESVRHQGSLARRGIGKPLGAAEARSPASAAARATLTRPKTSARTAMPASTPFIRPAAAMCRRPPAAADPPTLTLPAAPLLRSRMPVGMSPLRRTPGT